MNTKDLLSISDLSPDDIGRLLSDAVELKARGWNNSLSGKTLALVFEKPSLRTRVSFELAMKQLGGEALYLSPAEVGLGKREPVADVARVLSRFVDVIACRTFSHDTLVQLAKYADIPIINALSDLEHPCQALADIMTIYEKKGELKGLNLAYIGDGNNCANSLLLACAMTGINCRLASPEGYLVDKNIFAKAKAYAEDSGAELYSGTDLKTALRGADVIYTDVWTSMGQEAESEKRLKDFAGFQVNAKLVSLADKDAIIMHPLPAHYGEEVDREILECPQSVIFDQAENRLHAQKAVLRDMLGGLEIGGRH
ncbi:ornithine carbamoyltransferase [Dehalococcoides mccartyi]|uniref:ornithine carbamoyltransferase n=1 Tax=Dehalococcoides mccartyi TaxID=61435 RepID=UPI0004E07EBE|nr:ornithine carbamoyltransferase [Dehalococcoides mccartyi]AII58345.1 ornithine carbamoyltransferase [Dehalococcoides mccartyi CG1]APH12920.1 ornithine carbamoyltransferase [Dehalococcoides mccartyi]